MSYWRGTRPQPARFAQFTSSGFKNVMPTNIACVDRTAGFAQQMIRANLGTERLGVGPAARRPGAAAPVGAPSSDLVPVMRSRLHVDAGAAADLGLARRQRPDDPDTVRPGPRPAGSTRPSRPTGAGGSRRCSTSGAMPSARQADPAAAARRRGRSTAHLADRGDRPRNGLPGHRRAAPARAGPHAQRPPDPVPRQLRRVPIRQDAATARSTRSTRCTPPFSDPDQPAAADPEAGGIPGAGRAAGPRGRGATDPAAAEGARDPRAPEVR